MNYTHVILWFGALKKYRAGGTGPADPATAGPKIQGLKCFIKLKPTIIINFVAIITYVKIEVKINAMTTPSTSIPLQFRPPKSFKFPKRKFGTKGEEQAF